MTAIFKFAVGCLLMGFSTFGFALPDDLQKRMVQFHFERGDYASTLSSISKDEYKSYPVMTAVAQTQLGLTPSFTIDQLKQHLKTSDTPDVDRLRIANMLYNQDDCRTAVRYLKGKAPKLSPSLQSLRAYLRGQCFIELGKNNFAAQSLSIALEGELSAVAYYNLATDYAFNSRNPKRALVSLRVARDMTNNGESANELTNRINLGAGALYLKHDKPDMAVRFFDEMDIGSAYATQGLYLSGLAKVELKDYRAAVQVWQANLQHNLAEPGVAESLLALPNVQAQSGYQTLALESYLAASKLLQQERAQLAKLKKALKKYGAIEVLLRESSREDLAWFLGNSGVGNTIKNGYLRFLYDDEPSLYWMQLYSDMRLYESNLQGFSAKLKALRTNLKAQGRVNNSTELNKAARELTKRIQAARDTLSKIEQRLPPNSTSRTSDTLSALETRLASLPPRVNDRKKAIPEHIQSIDKALKKIDALTVKIAALYSRIDGAFTNDANNAFERFDERLHKHYEQAELGFIQILESHARLTTKRTNLLDGRYQ
ncbi:hypothetical protein A3739_08815 [Oleiphilus sp. HI0067]|nr:hypothetical protein A3739_08815 [Oleiphilus sp. HI0067]